ncbi:MAG: restriction endonuclease subunit S [Gammaproteobacteria bacterium]|nr:restriction endonuclease subunit S [Gammaproteobacteria bacterium]
MREIVRLSDVAEIALGQTFRGKAEGSSSTSEIKLIQIKDIRDGVLSDVSSLPFANIDESKLKIVLRKNDLLLPLRGSRHEASIFRPDVEYRHVTTTNQVAIIRPSEKAVSVEYLLWYFNSSIGRNRLASLATGSTVSSIRGGDLASLTIPLPAFPVQARLADMYFNWFRQKEVLSEMITNGGNLTDRLCVDLLENGVLDG